MFSLKLKFSEEGQTESQIVEGTCRTCQDARSTLPGEVLRLLRDKAAGFPCPFEASYDDLHRDGL